MLKFENPKIPFEDRLQDEKFIAVLKVFFGDEVYPIKKERFLEHAVWEEDNLLWRIKLINSFPRTINYNLFFSEFKMSVEAFNKYLIIKSGGIILTEIESSKNYNLLKKDLSIPIDDFITHSFKYKYQKAQRFITQEGRKKSMRRYFDSMKKYEEQMYPNNIQRLQELALTIETNGVEDKPKQDFDYLTAALERIKLKKIHIQQSSPSELEKDTSDSLWAENVSYELFERFVTAIFLHDSRNGILLKDYYKYPKYYGEDLGIYHPEKLHRKLISDGYLAYANIETKLKCITVSKIKSILSKYSLSTKGDREELIRTALSNINPKQLKVELNYYKLTMLTENGESFLSFMEGYVELYHCGWGIYLYEYEALRKQGILNFSEAAEIIIKERDKNPDFLTKQHLAELYYKEKEFSLSLAYYIQSMYYETDIPLYSNNFVQTDEEWAKEVATEIAEGRFFAPETQNRIAKLAEYFTEDMIERCYTDNPKVKSFMSKPEFRKAVHDALKSSGQL